MRPSRTLLAALLAVALALVAAPAHAITYFGGDYGGANLHPSNGDVLSGTFTNVGSFHIPVGSTVYVDPGVPLSVSASHTTIAGTLHATGAGYAGGASVPNGTGPLPGQAGQGPGGGGGGVYGAQVHGSGGGGGGYGGPGGDSYWGIWQVNPQAAPGGVTHGDESSPTTEMGSGGGSGAGYGQPDVTGASGAGGAGGGSIALYGWVDLDGLILAGAREGSPGTGGNSAGGGGGAGGTVLLDGLLFLDGFISVAGADGADGIGRVGFGSGGGGGGGGRIKLYGASLLGSAFSYAVSGGQGGASNTAFGKDGEPGGPGTFHNATSTYPEPASLTLLALGGGLGLWRRRRARR